MMGWDKHGHWASSPQIHLNMGVFQCDELHSIENPVLCKKWAKREKEGGRGTKRGRERERGGGRSEKREAGREGERKWMALLQLSSYQRKSTVPDSFLVIPQGFPLWKDTKVIVLCPSESCTSNQSPRSLLNTGSIHCSIPLPLYVLFWWHIPPPSHVPA